MSTLCCVIMRRATMRHSPTLRPAEQGGVARDSGDDGSNDVQETSVFMQKHG